MQKHMGTPQEGGSHTGTNSSRGTRSRKGTEMSLGSEVDYD